MEQVKWFDRKFVFPSEQSIFPAVIERLLGTPLRLTDKINRIPNDRWTVKHTNSWSIQENVGHLVDLEPLWQGRLDDILGGAKYLRPTDLENKKTDNAHHNEEEMDALLTQFQQLRETTIDRLQSLSEDDIYKHARHPRLESPMRTMDLFLFVAEHDDHHLARISELNRKLA